LQEGRGILFTAFEPSGDDHASVVISELRRRYPSLPIYAWGGRKMELAGATIIERTGEDAVMGLPGIQKIIEHKRINQRIDDWLAANPVSLHVPVDSPAANTPICEIAKARGVRVVHLVAPQIWAWGRWRIHKLRRVTDLVLCMFPFEPDFFARRNVPSRFIGHFLFEKPLDMPALDRRAAAFGDGSPRIAMMPGSRPEELALNFPLLLDAFAGLRAKHPEATGVVAATSDRVADQLRAAAKDRGGWPDELRIVVQDTDAVVRWCTLALVKSGTVTLQVARQGKPMVVFYKKSSPFLYLMARAVLSTKVFSLPNVLARSRIVPEFIPHFGSAKVIIEAADELITDPAKAAAQNAAVADVLAPLRGVRASELAADAIAEIAQLGEPESAAERVTPLPRLVKA
jgi:lipid-A-disaccharide synthase